MAITESIVKKKLMIRMPSSNSLLVNLDRKSCEKVGSNGKPPVLNGCNKRKAELVLDGEKEKRRMNPVMKQQCGAILEKLITHPDGWIFKFPVDPVALNIPDYFSIISNPMDLGTIKSKLVSNRYFTAEQFASDIRLTFSNAMLYNPPDNRVHRIAKDLECMFTRRWKLLEAKWERETATVQHVRVSSGSDKIVQDTMTASCKKSQGLISCGIEWNTQDTRKSCSQKSQGLISCGIEKNTQDTRKAWCENSQDLISRGIQKNAQFKKTDIGSNLVDKRSMSLEEKRKLRKDLTEMLKGKMNGKMQTVLQKFGFLDTVKEKIDLDIDAFPNDILWELKRVLKDSPDATSAKDNEYKVLSTQMKIQDSESKILSIHPSRMDLDSGFLLTKDSGNGLDEENMCPSSSLSRTVTSTAAISGEGWSPLIDDEQCLKKALRAAMLKSRFAETISKANGDKADAQQERERLERLQHVEEAFKARIREEQLKKEAELKRQREKQREVARLAIQMMERTVDLEDNLMIFKELERLTQCSPTYIVHGYGPVMVLRSFRTGEVLKPLEQLGLQIKEEVTADYDEETSSSWEGEEGEILG
ncbi:hypothetical protein ACH5RR_018260 [Cinchona calisaya]|uniref:Bromo domain-containing protein n=1 Tax=Cinchona calisaya TaxID=153742 RepID=A0ABD2ZL18_9GENT